MIFSTAGAFWIGTQARREGERMESRLNDETSLKKVVPEPAADGTDHGAAIASISLTSRLRTALPADDARGQFLSSTRREMYDSLALFHTHVKGVVSFMLGLVTAVLGIVSLVVSRNPSPMMSVVGNAAPVILVLLLPFSIVSVLVIGRYYKLYVAALVYAARLHEEEGLGDHFWFVEVNELRQRLGSGTTDDKVVRVRTRGWPHSLALYSTLILVLGVVSAAIAATIWLTL
jgi:hypothetical protein